MSQGGFFLCRLLLPLLSGCSGSAMTTQPPLACQLHRERETGRERERVRIERGRETQEVREIDINGEAERWMERVKVKEIKKK